MASLQDLISQGYGGYRGWSEEAAIEDYKKTGGQGKYDPGSSQQYAQQYGLPSQQYTPQTAAQPFQDIVAQSQKMYREAAAPAIASLEATKPEIQAGVASKTKLLSERYSNLIADIKGGQQKAEQRQTVVTAGELGKRGIDPTSTIYQQELTSALQPVTSEYIGLLKGAATEQMAGQQQLAELEQTQLRNVANTIAELQSGAGTNAINTALQLYQQAQRAAETAQTNAEAKRQSDIANALQQKIYETISLPESQISIANTRSLISDRGKTGVSGDYNQYYSAPGVTNVTNRAGLQSQAGGTFIPPAKSWSKQ